MSEEIVINKSFKKFLDKHEKIINKLFNVVAPLKKYCPNVYKYSKEFPPLRKNFKYTDKLFIACIIYICLNNSSWNSFIGPIPGKQVHKKFMEYSNKGIFKELFDTSIKAYLKKNKEHFKTISIDSSNIQNRACKDITHKNPYNKNKRAAKISTIVDPKGIPLAVSVTDSKKHDSKLFTNVFNAIINNNVTNNVKKKINNKTILLADKGYDTKKIRNKIIKSKIKCIIPYNKRNTKDPKKIKTLTDSEKKIYKKRIKVEHYFGFIKKYPKINCVYEKTLSSYSNILFLVSSMIIINNS